MRVLQNPTVTLLTNTFMSKGKEPIYQAPKTKPARPYMPTKDEVSQGFYMKGGIDSKGNPVKRKIFIKPTPNYVPEWYFQGFVRDTDKIERRKKNKFASSSRAANMRRQ